MKITIEECDACHAKVPSCFLKIIGPVPGYAGTAKICHPCYSAGASDGRKLPPFFKGKTKAQVARLRAAVFKQCRFPETLCCPVGMDKKAWSYEFAAGCDRKAKWYGHRDVFEFFETCLK